MAADLAPDGNEPTTSPSSALPRLAGTDLHRTVVVPTLDEVDAVGTLADLAAAVREDEVADRFLLADGGSSDGTPEAARAAGLEVVDVVRRPPGAPVRGKGDSIWRVADLETDVLVFRDADVVGVGAAELAALASAVERAGIALAKGTFTRLQHRDGPPRELSGRITEFVARPLLGLVAPELHLPEPLSGQFAVRSRVLADLPVVTRYGVDVGLAIDVAATFGPDAVATVDLGSLTHRSKDDASLVPMAHDVAATILGRRSRPLGPGDHLTTSDRDAIMGDRRDAPVPDGDQLDAGVAPAGGDDGAVESVLPCAGPDGPLLVRPARRAFLAALSPAAQETS